MKIRILHVIHSLQIGGAENIVSSYARFHDSSRYNLAVCTFRPNGKLVETIKSLDIAIHCLESSSSSPRSFFRLSRILRSGVYHIVHFHNPLPVLWGAPAALLSRVPVRVLTEHSISYQGRLGKGAALYRKLRRTMDVVIAVSEEVRRSHLLDMEAERLMVIHNGVDLGEFSPSKDSPHLRLKLGLPENGYVIGNIGNLTPQKGQGVLLAALKILISRGIPVVLIIAGEGVLRKTLEYMANDLEIARHVHFLGRRRDVPDLLRAMDIAVFSSLREGFPVSVLEAMATGKPVVATNVGGNQEAVVNGVTGLLVPPKDPEALALSVERLFRDQGLRLKMAKAARHHAEKYFSVEQMIARTEGLYENLLQTKYKNQPKDFSV